MDKVVLRYHRVGELSSGELVTPAGTTAFEEVAFQRMIGLLSRELRTYTDAEVVFGRNDKGGLIPFVLDPETVNLIRTDPVMATRSMTAQVTPAPRARSVPPPVLTAPILRAGHRALAEVFGDELYCCMREDAVAWVECPGCGMWNMLPPFVHHVGLYSCLKNCRISLTARVVQGEFESYLVMRAADLLATGQSRFFFPREWNGQGKVWVTRERLAELYGQWLKEKENLHAG